MTNTDNQLEILKILLHDNATLF